MASSTRDGFWNNQVWTSIDDGVTKAVGAIRICQKVFPTLQVPGVNSISADQFDPVKMSITEGVTKPFAELAVEFSLTNGQVNADAAGATAMTLSKFAAKDLALAEDMVILQGKSATPRLPATVRVESGGDSLGNGLLGLVRGGIVVEAPDVAAPTNSGGKILTAISKGIAALTNEQQAPPWALILGTDAFAATWGGVINGAPAYTVLDPVLTGGIYGTGAMPPELGLLIALGGDPTTIYSGSEPTTEPTTKTKEGLYFFRSYERVQFVARDPRAFVALDFAYLGAKKKP